MDEWITLQETAERLGVRKGTLAMWRNRDKFPFETRGEGRNLRVNAASVEAWLKEHGKELRKRVRKAARKGTKKAAAATAKKAKRRGRPPGSKNKKKAKAGARRGRKPGRPARAAGLLIQGPVDLGTVQRFVAEVRQGCDVQALPTEGGILLTTVKS